MLSHAFEDADAFIDVRIKNAEKMIKQLSFKPGEPETWLVVQDFAGVPVFPPGNLKAAIKKFTEVFTANYPEFKGKSP